MAKRWITLLVSLVAMCNIALADLPFRNHRYDAFKVLPKQTSENIVFIGNSITNMHEWWEAFGDHNVLGRGVSGAVSDEVVANLGSLITGTPGKVFLMIGTNDLGTNGMNNAAHVAKNVRIIVNYIKHASPSTKIYVQSILPSAQRNQTLQQETNEELKKICAEEELTYVDLWEKLLPVAQNNPDYTKDKLHLCGAAYRVWCKAIQEQVLGMTTTYRDTDVNKDGGLGGSEGMRVTAFGMHPVKDGDILLIGDEMVHGGEWHELLGSDKVKNRGNGWGYSGPGIANITKSVPVILKGRDDNGEPAKIFIYAGTADANGSDAIADIKARYQTLVETVRQNAPNAEIYVQALLPKNNADNNTNRVIPINTAIREIAESMTNVTYVDDYTPLAKDGVANTAYFSGNYLYGKGYAKVASILAPLMGLTAKSETETDGLYALYAARNAIVANVRNLNSYVIGSGVGQYPETAVNEMKAKADEVYALLANPATTTEQLTAKNTEVSAQFATLNQSIVMPQASTDGNEHWYKFYTPNRGSRYMTNNGAAQAVTGNEANNYAKSMWKLVDRGNNTFDIINRKDNTYLSPASDFNTAINTVATAPAAGWTLSYANAAGTFIISSGEVQLNQTQEAQGYKVYNWSNLNSKGQDRNDTGCQYAIEEVTTDPEEEPVIVYKPRVALTNITLDGTKPYKIDDRLANRVYALDELSVAIDFTLSEANNNGHFLVGSSNSGTTELCALGATNGAVRMYTPSKSAFYSGNTTVGTTRHQVVVTLRKGTGYTLYKDGVKLRDINATGDFKAPVFGSVNGVDGLYLGGVVTSEGENILPATGTIHSVRFFDHVFTAPEVATLSYEDIVDTNPEGDEMEIRISTGTLRNNNGTENAAWNATWTSTATDPTLTLNSNGKNNMTQANGYVVGRIGRDVSSCTYTLSVPEGYIIKGWSMDIAQENTNAGQITAGGTTYNSKANEETHIEVTGLKERTATFVLGGNNNGGLVFKNFFVAVVEDTRAPEPRFEVFIYDNTPENNIQSRIPAITTAQNGNVIVASDYRYSGADIGMSSANDGKIDLRYRVSKDNGKTWSKIMTLAKARGKAYAIATGDSLHAAFGDPCLVADRESARMMLLSCSGVISFPNGQRTNHQGIARIYSNDNGETWDTLNITDISAPIYDQFDSRADGPVRAMFIGSGKISQSHTVKIDQYYRLYCAALVKLNGGANVNFVLYSDDFGGSWKVLGGVDTTPIPSGGDEPKADELPDGSVIISSRATGGRFFNIYTFTDAKKGEGYWSNSEFSGQSNNGTAALGNACNGEIMFVPVVRKADSKKMYLALQSVPMGPGGRKNVGIYYKGLESPAAYASPAVFAPNWEGHHQSSSIGSAYSTMTWQKDNTVGFLFEEETYRAAGGYTIVYKNYSVEQITDSLYTYDAESDREAFAFPADALDARWEDAQTMVGPNVGNITAESLTSVKAAYNAYKTTPSQENYEAFAAAIAGTEQIGVNKGIMYRLRNSDRKNNQDNQPYYLVANTEGLTAAMLNEESTDQLFSFIPTEKEGVFYVANEANNVYIGRTGRNETKIPVVTIMADTTAYRVASDRYGRSSLSCTMPGGPNPAIHLAADCTRLVPWVAQGSPASLWYIEPTDIPSDIENVPVQPVMSAKDAIYDLSGRRVTAPAAGIYIRNGKKYIKK